MYGDTPLIMVEDQTALLAMVETLRQAPVIGLDTEADSFHHYREKLCLIQISDLVSDYIVDPLKVADLSPLAAVLEDPNIVKVLHGGDYDVVSIKRDTGIQIRHIFDTMVAAQFLGMPRVGLADLIGRYFGVVIDKRYQRHDWAQRPLEIEHLDYARGDTHWLLALRDVLTRRLEQTGRLRAMQEECAVLEERQWGGREHGPADFLRVKGSTGLDEPGFRVLRALWAYRDQCAREADRPAFKVLPDPVLLSIAQQRPTTPDALAEHMRRGSAMARRHGDALLQCVTDGLADPTPLPDKQSRNARSKTPRAEEAPGIDRLMAVLKVWRNDVVSRRGLAPVVVANNGLLKEIARLAPTTQEALAAVPGIRAWQVEDFGAEILALVGSIESSTSSGAKKRRRRRRRTGGGESEG
jgi:ribonuclease D